MTRGAAVVVKLVEKVTVPFSFVTLLLCHS